MLFARASNKSNNGSYARIVVVSSRLNSAVIMTNNRSNFNYKPEEYLNGKNICIIGTVKDYKGKPEIVVEKQEQVLVQ